MSTLDNFLQHAARIIGGDHIHRHASSANALTPSCTIEPATPSELARVLALANEHHLTVAPRGAGTKSSWISTTQPAKIVFSTRRLDRVLEHASGDLTATIEAGCTLRTLQSELQNRGQRLPLDPLWPEQATLGGIFATADSGMLRSSFGGPRDLILGVTVALADGTLARSGGKVVKNVAGYDLPKLFTGSFGTLGIITQLTLRLHPIPEATEVLHFDVEGIENLSRFIAAMTTASLYVVGVQYIATPKRSVRVSIRIEGSQEAIRSKIDRVAEAATTAGANPSSEQSPLTREDLFHEEIPFVVCRTSLLRTDLATMLASLEELSHECSLSWRFIAQHCGVGLLQLACNAPAALMQATQSIRARIASLGGTASILAYSRDLVEVLTSSPANCQPPALVRRIKETFDPNGIMNPNRFLESQ